MLPHGGSHLITRDAIASCVAYALSSVVLNIVNKAVFSKQAFHFPWVTLAFQNLISSLLAVIASSSGLVQGSVGINAELAVELTVPMLFFVAFIFSNAEALRHMSLPVLTVFKSLAPMGVTIFERLFFKDTVAKEVYFSMALILLSTLITFASDLEFSVLGYTWAIVNVLANIGYLGSLRFFVSDSFTTVDKTIHSNLLALLPILPIAVLVGEVPEALYALRQTPIPFRLAFLLSGALTMALSASSFWCLSMTDGSTYSFVGGLNKIPIVLLGYWLFGARISSVGWVGIAMGVLAGIIFVKYKSRSRPGRRQSARLLRKATNSDLDLGAKAANLGPQPTLDAAVSTSANGASPVP